MNKLFRRILFFTVFLFLCNFLFGWMNANVDSYNYYAIGEFFRTGTYPFQEPFVYLRPTTISPPLYGLFFTLTSGILRADILLHALQLLLLGITSYLLYQLLRGTFSSPMAGLISCLFALLPVNMIYAGSVMTEIPAQFLFTLWLFFMITGYKRKRPEYYGYAVLVSSTATLLKYNLGIFLPASLVCYLRYTHHYRFSNTVFPLLGVILICFWIGINYRITGTWGLYDTRGTQLYNQFVAQTKLLPKESDPSVQRMRSLLPPNTNIAVYYWDIQQALSEKLGHDWLKVDHILFDVAWASVRTHPVAYLTHSVANYALIHIDHVPHWENIGNMGRSDVYGINRPFCGQLGSVVTCAPVISLPFSFQIWNFFIYFEMAVFRLLAAPVFFAVFLPSLFWSCIEKKNELHMMAFFYLIGTIPIAFTIHPDPRYVIPFYPLAVLLICNFISMLFGHFQRRYTSYHADSTAQEISP